MFSFLFSVFNQLKAMLKKQKVQRHIICLQKLSVQLKRQNKDRKTRFQKIYKLLTLSTNLNH